MAKSNFLMQESTSTLDLACLGISADAKACVCRDGCWGSEEIVDCKIELDGLGCHDPFDYGKYDIPVNCVADVEDKCGCIGCGSGEGEGEGGLTVEEVTAIAQQEASDCVAEVKTSLEALKNG